MRIATEPRSGALPAADSSGGSSLLRPA